jgi:hypothetical protein
LIFLKTGEKKIFLKRDTVTKMLVNTVNIGTRGCLRPKILPISAELLK